MIFLILFILFMVCSFLAAMLLARNAFMDTNPLIEWVALPAMLIILGFIWLYEKFVKGEK